MANSPGPSSSTIDPPNEAAPPKKKRTRRKPRHRDRNRVSSAPDESTDAEFTPWIPKFMIQAVTEPAGIFYRQRDKAGGPINLKSFIQSSTLPCVFQTEISGETISALEVLEKFKKLKLNGLIDGGGKGSPWKKKGTPKGKKRKKKRVLFQNYLSKEEVLEKLKSGEFIKGFVRINPKNSKEAYVGNIDVSKTDYIIGSVMDRNRALEGDEVVLKFKSEEKNSSEENKKIVEVVYITQMFRSKMQSKNGRFFPKYPPKSWVAFGLKTGELVKGTLRIDPNFSNISYVEHANPRKPDYIISSVIHRNRALEGDEVILTLLHVREDKRLIMRVVHIAKKIHPRTAVGYLEPMEHNREYALFTPRDKRIPKMNIPKISWPSGFSSNPQLYKDILFLARISEWNNVHYALGTITENLGLTGDLKVESLAILKEFCLDPTPFGNDIKQFLPKTTNIPQKEFSYREDFRKECVFTIDPLTARDLDDAVSCKELPNGNFEVGVHISDASFFLKEKTKLDEMVKMKAVTIYMTDNVYHMLPVDLCLHCSLLPGHDKLTFSVVWELTPEGTIVNQRITRSIINSCVQLAYEHAQMMIDEPTKKFATEDLPQIHHDFTPEDLSRVVNNLEKIAVCLREKRCQNGSLKIDQVKISFSLDPSTGEPSQFWIYENKPAHRLIEEFMLLANMSVAEFINTAFPDLAFLRMHEPPKPTMMVDLQKNLETIGLHIDISSSGGIQSSLNKYVSSDYLGQSRMVVLNHLVAKPMKRARYFCAGALENEIPYSHFALSIPIYTHFTSPIRRYADIMVHRLLAAGLQYCDKPKWNAEEVAFIAETCNRQKYNSKRASEASSDLYLAHFIEKNQPFIQDAVVVDTKERSIDAIVLSTGSVVRLYTNNFGKDVKSDVEEIKIQRDEGEDNTKKMWKIRVTFPRNQTQSEVSIVLEIFTLVKVALTRKPKSNKLEATLVRPLQQISLL